MKALLIVSHGSRRPASNMEVNQLADVVRQQVGESYRIVESAFLELAEPLIPDGIKKCVEQGASEILVIPYFLAAGRHVAEDIPEILDAVRPSYANIAIRLAPHLGASNLMPKFLADIAEKFSE